MFPVRSFPFFPSDYPAASDVRDGVSYDATTGTLDLPAEADVKRGVSFDGGTKTGTHAGSAVSISPIGGTL